MTQDPTSRLNAALSGRYRIERELAAITPTSTSALMMGGFSWCAGRAQVSTRRQAMRGGTTRV